MIAGRASSGIAPFVGSRDGLGDETDPTIVESIVDDRRGSPLARASRSRRSPPAASRGSEGERRRRADPRVAGRGARRRRRSSNTRACFAARTRADGENAFGPFATPRHIRRMVVDPRTALDRLVRYRTPPKVTSASADAGESQDGGGGFSRREVNRMGLSPRYFATCVERFARWNPIASSAW